MSKDRMLKSIYKLLFFIPSSFPVILYITFCFSLPASSQVFDSISSSLKKKPRITGEFSTKTSFIDDLRSPIFTAHLGVDFDKRIEMGGGVSWLLLRSYDNGKNNQPFYLDKILFDSTGKADTIHPALKFFYFNYYVEYIFYRNKRWQFSVPLQFGIGSSKYEYSYLGKIFAEKKKTILLYEPYVSGYFKFFRWLGIKADVGYRFMLVNNKAISVHFNSPVYNMGLVIFWGDLYKGIFPNSKLANKKES